MESALFFQGVLLATDAPQPVGKECGAEKVHPRKGSPVEGVADADDKVCKAEKFHIVPDFIQMSDAGIHIRKHIERALFSGAAVVPPAEAAANGLGPKLPP